MPFWQVSDRVRSDQKTYLSFVAEPLAKMFYRIQRITRFAANDLAIAYGKKRVAFDSKRYHFQPIFRDVTHRLNHVHHERLFDDFARQPLLMKLLSQPGPGVAWFDLDADGHDELILGAGKGGRLAVYRTPLTGPFEALEAAPLEPSCEP